MTTTTFPFWPRNVRENSNIPRPERAVGVHQSFWPRNMRENGNIPAARTRWGGGVKALVFERNVARYAAARVAGAVVAGRGAAWGPLRLRDADVPDLPTPGWERLRPRLAGICGSDLATIDSRSSRYFEPIVSFPFVPGHEVVGDRDDGTRAVLEAVLGCVARGIDPPCDDVRHGRRRPL